MTRGFGVLPEDIFPPAASRFNGGIVLNDVIFDFENAVAQWEFSGDVNVADFNQMWLSITDGDSFWTPDIMVQNSSTSIQAVYSEDATSATTYDLTSAPAGVVAPATGPLTSN